MDREALEEEEEDLKLKEENPDYPGLSGLVRVARDEARGRFAVAEQNIPPGTLIAVADPTVALLNPDNKDLVMEHCLRCLKPSLSPHPCLTCSSVVFCSPECREALTGGFHKYQCQLNLYHNRRVDTEDAFNIFMVLQTLWQRPISFWRENLKLEKDELLQVGEMDLPYRNYWRMMRHKEDRSEKQFLKIIVISLFLMRSTRWVKYYSSLSLAGNPLKTTLAKINF